uniref:Uncharacterized protein n=1 Tax=Siphoviridae sp. cty3u30 TaxID=2825744 RepID=A0A8S5Q997_9CAUD|nr:MAG TPA: hypothetical protein [Siphoviridae sp. cty3u30]
MAYDKIVDSSGLDANLTSVADAIRAKGGTTAQLAFPSGFVAAVQSIDSGGGTDLGDVDVYIADFTDSTELSVLAGAVDKYARVVVS